MLFNSISFLLFGIVFFVLWPFLARRDGTRWGSIVVASFIFYGAWDWRFLFLLIASGMVDYLAALGMQRWSHLKNLMLMFSVVANIGSLAVFKYSAFVATNFESILHMAGVNISLVNSLPAMSLILPVGISFYTFQSMSYTIDVYRGELKPCRNIVQFFAYLAMFPQLVAGPIVRASSMLRQLAKAPVLSEDIRWKGTQLVAFGLFKKVVLADNLAPFVDAAFSASSVPQGTLYWCVIVSMFSFQIYYDFSGYSDIARGLVAWMGYDIGENFNHPYTACGMRDFWQRWHISLSTWFRDYVYIPLGGRRCGTAKAYRNLWISFLLSGLWHGAAWNFIAWGGLHAVFLSVERVTAWPEKLSRIPGGRLLGIALTLAAVWCGWLLFRATSFEQAVQIMGAVLGLSGEGLVPAVGKTEWFFLGLCCVVEFAPAILGGRKEALDLGDGWRRGLGPLGVACALLACAILRGSGNEFIYFQF